VAAAVAAECWSTVPVRRVVTERTPTAEKAERDMAAAAAADTMAATGMAAQAPMAWFTSSGKTKKVDNVNLFCFTSIGLHCQWIQWFALSTFLSFHEFQHLARVKE
jgi:hypothetical protein